jgi:hypothetical protein
MVLVACGNDPPAPPPPAQAPVIAPAPSSPPDAPPPPSHARMHATWTHIRAEEGCWYFSGPGGRDNKLEGDIAFKRDGDQVTATIGGAVFTGTYRDNVLVLERKSRHTADGTWNVDEKITGDYVGGKMVARYHYEECLVGTRCPNHCAIAATLTFTL